MDHHLDDVSLVDKELAQREDLVKELVQLVIKDIKSKFESKDQYQEALRTAVSTIKEINIVANRIIAEEISCQQG